MSKANDILLIADAPQLGAEKTSTAAIKLFEAQIISGLLFNCKSWIGITQAQIDELQSFQDNFLKKLLHLPVSTPKAILHWDGGMEMMKWRIAKRKLMFMKKMMLANSDNICKKAILNEIIIGTKGLASECKELSDELGIRDMRFCEVTKGEINRAIRTLSWNSRRAEMAGSTKVGDRVSDDPKDNSYMTYMTLNDSRLWMRVRARMMKGVKMNHKS